MPTEAAIFAKTLSQLTGRERRDAVACAVIESGGLYPYPMPRRALMEIQLHDVNASGIGEDQAIDNWIAAALKPAIRATDGRPDCPYDGQGMAPDPIRTTFLPL